jgi:hypothetical protein
MPTLRVVPELTRSVDIKLNERPLLLSAVGDLSSVQVARLSPQGRSPLARLGVATFRGGRGGPAHKRQNRRRAGSCGMSRPVIARAAYSMRRSLCRGQFRN